MLPLLRPYEWIPWFHSFTQSLGKESWLLSTETDKPILKFKWNFAKKSLSSHVYGFSSGHVWMCKLDYKESWAPKNWCFWTVVLEKTLESPLDCKEIQPVHPKGDQSWVLIGRTDVEAETPILWPPDAKSWLIWKDPDAGKDWGQEEKGVTEDVMVGWHYRINGHEFEQTPGDSEEQGSLACCSPRSRKESHSLAAEQQHIHKSNVGWSLLAHKRILPLQHNHKE